ncbi:hypothetical protein LAZ67_X000327 [Cordylochernes scorpioides]|uniref:Uncharacterized protein n=1 Tax=Cordylochernes scorpioides TaxID=51811 RepID=A0ABY6LSL0_9ARAC|nr:hypothetical protein LAZ67_X000327 [Cordylochernes scorpioides]
MEKLKGGPVSIAYIVNAYSLYLVNTGKRPSLAEFHINLIGQIIEKYHEARVQFPLLRRKKILQDIAVFVEQTKRGKNHATCAKTVMLLCVWCLVSKLSTQ